METDREKMKKVYLVGAGCGDYDLITLRGKQILERADCVIYDSLIDELLLDFVPPHAKRIFVGKRAGAHAMRQEQINEILVENGRIYPCVVRLKGGDPFVFGRGGEEIVALEAAGLSYEVVPGISSAYAVAELAGIPVTHREISRSFHVITGHLKEDLPPEHMRELAMVGGTLIFLMGLRNISYITEQLMAYGMEQTTPAAVITDGATARQKVLRSDLLHIAKAWEDSDQTAPGVIVIGDTAAFDLIEKTALPLAGRAVTITGTPHFLHEATKALHALGAQVETLDFLQVETEGFRSNLEEALTQIGSYAWLILTSANGARIFLETTKRMHLDLRRLSHLKIAVIGAGTKAVLAEAGLYADLMPKEYTTASLAEALVQQVKKGERLLIARAKKGSKVLDETLDAAGLSYEDVAIYDVTRRASFLPKQVERGDLIFGSASGVHGFFASGCRVKERVRLVCIGDVTAEALRSYGSSNSVVVAREATIPAIAETLVALGGEEHETIS